MEKTIQRPGMVVMMEPRQKADTKFLHCNRDSNGVFEISSSHKEQHYVQGWSMP